MPLNDFDLKLKGVDGESTKAVPVEDLSMNYEEVKFSYARPENRAKLQKLGFSARGIDELKGALALSNHKDREVAAAIIGSLLD